MNSSTIAALQRPGKLGTRLLRAGLFGVAVLVATAIVGLSQDCKVTSERSEHESIGANFEVEFAGIKKLRAVKGQVIDAAGQPIFTAIIDVYRANVSSEASKGTYLGSYLVDEDGRFCLKDLPDGDYMIRAGTNAFAFAHAWYRVQKQPRGSKKPIVISLQVGN